MLVPRKDGTLRCCIHYRLLIVVTEKDLYPLPRMDEYIDQGFVRMNPWTIYPHRILVSIGDIG